MRYRIRSHPHIIKERKYLMDEKKESIMMLERYCLGGGGKIRRKLVEENISRKIGV